MDRQLPSQIALVYRQVGSTHVFSSSGIEGLVHIGSCNRKKAFEKVFRSLSRHVTHVYGREAVYEAPFTYSEFADTIEGADIGPNFVLARLACQSDIAQAAH